ncbi:MAG: NifB/NifX family molybdenum-iron cluster-binding protein [Smithella sp.]|jgi:predicted Fe-Mo cluster-binding NifX family protein|nr:NifB/NifX family molybdenum-iron cluster-binding protein [Smithella sp.]
MKSESQQKIALAVWGNIISPVFDSTRMALIAESRDGKVVSSRHEWLGPELPYSRALRLSGWDIRVLICGAISAGFASTIEVYGIEVIPFISGEVQQVLDAYLNGTLTADVFHMPGFVGRGCRNRYRGGRR